MLFSQQDDWPEDCKAADVFIPMNTFPSSDNAKHDAKKKKSKKNKKKPKQKCEYVKGRGPLAPRSEGSDELPNLHKIQSGRIEKSKNANKFLLRESKLNGKSRTSSQTPGKALLAAIAALDNDETPIVKKASIKTADTNPVDNLATKLKSELLGGRFRYLNEQLYTVTSQKAEKLFSEDSEAFKAYHDGYRHQVEKWPMNPLNRIIKTLKKMSKTLVVGDFGCGEGLLAKSVVNKVYSMDLVSCRDDIIACNITNTPLQSKSLDIAVYCLSLMGTNLIDYFLEANRVLKLHGVVHIAEIQSRFEDVRQFVKSMNACGFDLLKKDVAMNYFYFFQFRKMRHVGKDVKLQPFSLKPCLYRRR